MTLILTGILPGKPQSILRLELFCGEVMQDVDWFVGQSEGRSVNAIAFGLQALPAQWIEPLMLPVPPKRQGHVGLIKQEVISAFQLS